MIYTELTKKAMSFAFEYHKNQKDKGGTPYVFHLMGVADKMPNEILTAAALLHDTLEDTAATVKDLESVFPPRVVHLVQILTRTPDVKYFDYIRAIKKDSDAVIIKLADLENNMIPGRMPNGIIPESLQERYDKSVKILKEK